MRCWNTFVDHFYPGGVLLNQLAKSYDELMVGLDHDRRDILARQPYFDNPDYAGPQPVDEDGDGALCRAAVREHLGNFHMPDFLAEFRFTDDRLPYDPSFGALSFSPCHYADGFSPDWPSCRCPAGWTGPALPTARSPATCPLPNRQHMLLGPWDHGARTNVSPWRDQTAPDFDVLAEVLRFFDQYLMGLDTGLGDEAPIHYFSFTKSAGTRPMPGRRKRHEDPALAAGSGAWKRRRGTPARTPTPADYTVGTGQRTRHERLAALNTTDYYADWPGRDAAMQSSYQRALEAAARVITAIRWSTSVHRVQRGRRSDPRLSVGGRGRRQRSLRHRGRAAGAAPRTEMPAPADQDWTWPYRDFSRASAAPLVPGQPARMRFALLPTSWRFRRRKPHPPLDRRWRTADHYVQLPHGRPPLLDDRSRRGRRLGR